MHKLYYRRRKQRAPGPFSQPRDRPALPACRRPSAANFRFEERAVPAASAGQLLLRTPYLSLDPCMRGRLSDRGTWAIVPAIANAIFAATGKRLRKLPIGTTALKQPA